jgi:LysM repeat protein
MTDYNLRIPQGKKDLFLENLSRIPEEKRVTVDSYIVTKGDTFQTVSKKTGVPVQVILDLNDMEKIMPLKAGTKIDLPPKEKYVRLMINQEKDLKRRRSTYQKQTKTKNLKAGNKIKQLLKNNVKD